VDTSLDELNRLNELRVAVQKSIEQASGTLIWFAEQLKTRRRIPLNIWRRLELLGYLRDRGVRWGRERGVHEPSLLYLTKRSFDELTRGGHLRDYPPFTWKQLEKRIDVSPLTIPHELEVLNVKTALSCALARTPYIELMEFLTWPRLYEFRAAQRPRDGYPASRVTIRPDGDIRLYEQNGEDTHEHFLFLDVDRGTEHHRRWCCTSTPGVRAMCTSAAIRPQCSLAMPSASLGRS
jgi:hypothetical protein